MTEQRWRYESNYLVEPIKLNSVNERTFYHNLAFYSLRESIRINGLTTPIGIEEMPDGIVEVRYGERRLAAVKSLNLKTVKLPITAELWGF